jgi:hypothetical protein
MKVVLVLAPIAAGEVRRVVGAAAAVAGRERGMGTGRVTSFARSADEGRCAARAGKGRATLARRAAESADDDMPPAHENVPLWSRRAPVDWLLSLLAQWIAERLPIVGVFS